VARAGWFHDEDDGEYSKAVAGDRATVGGMRAIQPCSERCGCCSSKILKPECSTFPPYDETRTSPYDGHSRAFENVERGSKHALSTLAAVSKRGIQSCLPCTALCVCFVVRGILGLLSLHIGSEGVVTFRCENMAGC